MVLLAKALSGGHVPVGAVLIAQGDLRQGVQPHGPRRGARLDLLEERPRDGGRHRDARGARRPSADRERRAHGRAAAATVCRRWSSSYELLKEVRGKGLMIGIEFGAPSSFKLKASWTMLETASKGLFCQLDHDPAVQGAQDPDPGRGPRQPHHQADPAAGHQRRRLRLDRARVRRA